MSNTLEYIGEMLPDGRISVDPSIAHKLRTGEKLRIRIEQIPDAPKATGKKELDATTIRLLERIKNAPRLGVIQGEIRREEIYGEQVDERRHSVWIKARKEDKSHGNLGNKIT